MTIKLRKRRQFSDEIQWERAAPFLLNPRGLLVHRVQSVCEFRNRGTVTHIAVHYWCGNSCCISPAQAGDSFLYIPPKDRLLCEFCEMRAKCQQQKSADELAGRHVHRGRVRVFQTCCQHKGSN